MLPNLLFNMKLEDRVKGDIEYCYKINWKRKNSSGLSSNNLI